MLQWRPRSKNEIIWNDRQGDHFASHILNVKTRKKRTLPHPFYTISPNGRIAVAPDFRRVNAMRPGYGYAGLPDPSTDDPAPKDSGIFRLDLETEAGCEGSRRLAEQGCSASETGRQDLIIPIADVVNIPNPHANLTGAKHYFNHLLFNPDGSRFIFLHRWRARGQRGFGTRMLTARPDGTDIHVVDDYGRTSHFIWRDTRHILAWAWHPSHGNAFYLYEDGTDKVEVIGKGVLTQNGHCSYLPTPCMAGLPGNKWILNDTYPDKERKQHVYLYNTATRKKIPLGRFYSPPQYKGEWRCDTHPRFSPDGRSVVIDSPHGSNGRQMYLIDISKIVG